jgi:hypothetical protein
MKKKIFLVLGIIFSVHSFAFSQTVRNPVLQGTNFRAIIQNAHTEVGWYKEWLDYTGGKEILPDSLPSQEKLRHSYMKAGFTSAMHEGPRASDVTNLPGPLPQNVKAEYFHVLEKKEGFSGMCPAFDFINDSTMVTLSFGRATTTLLLLRVTDKITLLDQVEIPGRGTDIWELINKKGREKVFHNTAGGAYSYLSDQNDLYIPGTNNSILGVKLLNDRIENEKVFTVNLRDQINAGNLVDESLHEKDRLNLLTALMPDMDGNIWFTSRHGIVGLVHKDKLAADGQMKIYASYIGLQGTMEKIKTHFPKDFEEYSNLENFKQQDSPTEMIDKFKSIFIESEETREEIQNSFSVGSDGVYIVSNYALYKLRFNEEKETIEMDPKWEKNFREGVLIYANDHKIKPGQLSAGSGTTPTLTDDRFVTICDNDSGSVNMCVFSQETGDLVFKHKLFPETGGAVENSVVAYKNSIIVGNTYGYTDVFKENPTPGGILRFDYNEDLKSFKKVENWPASGVYDGKTATPKLSTSTGLIYVYNRSDQDYNGHHDWQVTAIDYVTGLRVFYIKPYFNKGEFDDNVSLPLKWFSLGSKNYDRKVFNNIWGTFTIGPGNSFYIGVYRGFLRISSE